MVCQAEVDDQSRMCTSVEVMDTVSLPNAASDFAWIRPVLRPISTNKPTDASGVSTRINTLSSLSCFGWSRTTNNGGLVVDSSGHFDDLACGISRPIACCALVP